VKNKNYIRNVMKQKLWELIDSYWYDKDIKLTFLCQVWIKTFNCLCVLCNNNLAIIFIRLNSDEMESKFFFYPCLVNYFRSYLCQTNNTVGENVVSGRKLQIFILIFQRKLQVSRQTAWENLTIFTLLHYKKMFALTS
jgi:hypothetical protein